MSAILSVHGCVARLRWRAVAVIAILALQSFAAQGQIDPLLIRQYGYGAILDSVMTPDGSKVVTSSGDGYTRAWDVATGTELWSVNVAGLLAMTPDGAKVLVGANRVQVHAMTTGALLVTFSGPTTSLESLSVSSDGLKVVTASNAYQVKLWDLQTGAELKQMAQSAQSINRVACSPDGSRVVGYSYNSGMYIWDGATGKLLKIKGCTLGMNDHPMAYAPDGKGLLLYRWASGVGNVELWDTSMTQILARYPGQEGTSCALNFSKTGSIAVGGDGTGAVMLWDTATSQTIRTFKAASVLIADVAISADGKRVMARGEDNVARVWDGETGEVKWTSVGYRPGGEMAFFMPDGKRVLCSQNLVDIETGAVLKEYAFNKEKYYSLRLSADGRRIMTSHYNKACVWDAETGELLRTLNHPGVVPVIAISPDGTKAVTGGGSERYVGIWDIATSQTLKSFQFPYYLISSVAFSPDGERVAVGDADRRVGIWSVSSGQNLQWIYDDIHVGLTHHSVAFSPDGKTLLTGTSYGEACLWDLATGKKIQQMRPLKATGIYDAKFSPDGRFILTRSSSGKVDLWGTATGQLIRSPGYGSWAAFSPDGRKIWIAGGSAPARLVWTLAAAAGDWEQYP